MRTEISENLILKCEVLTPVHIGTGEEIADYEYIIRDGLFIKINLDKVFGILDEDEMDFFLQLNENSNYAGIRTFLQEKSNTQSWLNNVALYTIPVSNAVEKILGSDKNELNQGLIRLNYRDPLKGNPVIPGSSIKGALRTAVLNQLSFMHDTIPYNQREMNAQLLKMKNQRDRIDMGRDPFKYLKVADVSLPQSSTRIVFVRNVKKEGHSLVENKMQMVHEVTNCVATGQKLEFDLPISLSTQQNTQVKLNATDLVAACRNYYMDKFIKSDMSFFEGTSVYETLDELHKEIDFQTSFLIRLGRFSGKDSITLDKYKREGFSPKTRNLAEGKYPMGWIKCTVLN